MVALVVLAVLAEEEVPSVRDALRSGSYKLQNLSRASFADRKQCVTLRSRNELRQTTAIDPPTEWTGWATMKFGTAQAEPRAVFKSWLWNFRGLKIIAGRRVGDDRVRVYSDSC